MYELQLQHKKNKDILIKNNYKITQYINTRYKQVLYAEHKNGDKITIVA